MDPGLRREGEERTVDFHFDPDFFTNSQLSKHGQSFRRALPPGFAGDEVVSQSLGERLRRMIAELQSMTDYDMFLDGFSQRVRSARVGRLADFSTDATATEPREQGSTG
jgi:hypothetical protein